MKQTKDRPKLEQASKPNSGAASERRPDELYFKDGELGLRPPTFDNRQSTIDRASLLHSFFLACFLVLACCFDLVVDDSFAIYFWP